MGRRTAATAVILLLTLTSLLVVPGPSLVGADTGSRSTVYSTDFESGTDNWTHAGANDEWELGDPTYGPGYCHSGDNCWGTDLDDAYESNTNAYLRSPDIDLSGASMAYLEFWHYFDIFNIMFFQDNGYVEIWNVTSQDYDILATFNGSSGEEEWDKVTLDMDEYAGMDTHVRFRLNTDSFIEAPGWYIDDLKVVIDEQPAQEDHDLAVTEIQVKPPDPGVGQETYITVVVENKGDFEETDFQVELKIADPDTGKVVFTETKVVDAIEPGDTIKLTFTWKPAAAGMYLIEASVIIDIDNEPDNDMMIRRIRVGSQAHDIAVTALYLTPSKPQVGMITTISVVVENVGSFEEIDIKVVLKVFDPSKVMVLNKTQTIDLLEVGGKANVDFPWTPKAPGEHRIKAHAKLKHDAYEFDNEKEILVTVPNKGVDMAVENVSIEPPDAGPGFERTITVKVTNIGSIEATAVTLDFDISNSTSVVATGSEDHGNMGPGKSRKSSWKFTPTEVGTYTLKVTVKTTDDINPQNDQKVLVFVVPLIERDIGIESISALPRTGGLGVKRTILAQVANHGDMDESFQVQISVVDPNGTIVLNKDFDTQLPKGGEVTLSTDYTPVMYGVHTVTARAILDYDTEPANDEANLTFIVNFHDFHDIGIDSLTIDPRSGNQSRRNFAVHVKNFGSVAEVYDVTIWVYNGSGGLVQSFSSNNTPIEAGGQFSNGWNFLINQTGNFSVKAEASIAVDDFLDNNVMNEVFWITTVPITNDVGISKIFVTPRTGDIEERKMQVRVMNYGTVNETDVPLYVKVTWPGNEEILYDGVISGNITFNETEMIFINWTPPDHATYVVTATVNATVDEFAANDEMAMEFYAVKQVHMDLSMENLLVEPRTDYDNVLRTITASIMNYGDKEAKGKVQLIVRDDTGTIVHRSNKTITIRPGVMGTHFTEYIPVLVGSYEAEAIVTLVGDDDIEPANDRLNISFLAQQSPPPIDIYLVSVLAPGPWETGRDLDIIATITNIGTDPAVGTVLFELVDPDDRMTKWDRPFRALEPGRSLDLKITFNPILAGSYNVTVNVDVPMDADPGNNKGKAQFDVVAVGGKDGAVISLIVDKKQVCGLGFAIEAKISNVGSVTLGEVEVTLKVTGEGKTFDQKVNISLTREETRTVQFEFDAPGAGSYEFTVKVNAEGDGDKTNDAMTDTATACDPANIDTVTTVDPDIPWWLILVIAVISTIVIYNYIQHRKRGDRPPAGTSQPRTRIRR